MNSKDRILVLCIAMALSLCLIPSAMASTEEQQTNLTKDAAQLKIEALEAELGEEGMKKVADYLELQASLPGVVKASPYSWIAFAATDNKSQVAYLTAIDESDLEKENKEKLKDDLQDIWDRYPDKFVAADNLVLRDVDKIMEKRFIASVNLSELRVDLPNNGAVSIFGSSGIMWAGNPLQDFAYYACDGSAYRSYARNTADDPDNSGFDRCNEFANSAISAKNNRDQATAHQNFRYSSHYLSDSLPHLQLLTQILIEKESNGHKYRNLII